MSSERLLLDTVFVQALLNRRDQYHAQAMTLLPRVRSAIEVWVTEAVLVEIGNCCDARFPIDRRGDYRRALCASRLSRPDDRD